MRGFKEESYIIQFLFKRTYSDCCKENGLKMGKNGVQITNYEVTAVVWAGENKNGDGGAKEGRQIWDIYLTVKSLCLGEGLI